jgi:hypothetical protein
LYVCQSSLAMAVFTQATLSGQRAGNQGRRREYRRRAIFTCMHDDEKAQTQFLRRIICRSSARAKQPSLRLLFACYSYSFTVMRINKCLLENAETSSLIIQFCYLSNSLPNFLLIHSSQISYKKSRPELLKSGYTWSCQKEGENKKARRYAMWEKDKRF